MKYLLPIILMALSMPAYASKTYEESIRTKIICEEGYKYLLVWAESGYYRPPTVVQMKRAGDGAIRPPQPIKCD